MIDNKLCLPDPLDSLGHTNIVRLELIQSHSHSQRSSTEKPRAECPSLGHTLRREVVDDQGPG